MNRRKWLTTWTDASIFDCMNVSKLKLWNSLNLSVENASSENIFHSIVLAQSVMKNKKRILFEKEIAISKHCISFCH